MRVEPSSNVKESCPRKHGAALVLPALILICSLAAPARAAGADLTALIQSSRAYLDQSALSHGAMETLQSVYGSENLLWSRDGQETAQAQALLHELASAESYGLENKDYRASEIAQIAGAPVGGTSDPLRWQRFDVRVTAAALRFIADLHYGRVTPESAGFKLQQERLPFDLTATLRKVAAASDVPQTIATVEPPFFHYGLLKTALAQFRRISAESADWKPLPPPPAKLRVGDAYAGAPQLRHMLGVLGDMPTGEAAPADDGIFDATLSFGVRNFQSRHGLAEDGLLGKATYADLKTPPARWVRQIVLTLERWRWLKPFDSPPIIVNIPEFELYAFRTTEDRLGSILAMDVIVGKTYANTQTPVFEDEMKYVVLRPYWDVPRSITVKEMLPKIRANPRYLAAQRLELVAGPSDSSPVVPPTPENIAALAAGKLRVRQIPGEDNALGLAKFIFPNSYNVYLHSTPAHNLFKEPVRAFSHGCIRVSDPLALATLVLKNAPGDWSKERIDAAMHGDKTMRVDLTRPITVLILYATALATEAGPVMFFDDIYGYDKKLERQLALPAVR
jgi:murein L,D-transpeptidase YcbB/YkuD